jgi:tetratricopeptide (TPR) repeat protein
MSQFGNNDLPIEDDDNSFGDDTYPWKEQPIFISSTFRDMQAERDMLHDNVFPRLQDKLRKYHRTIAPVDLRNGVETVSIEKKEEKEIQVLTVCLDEIKRCQPFILVILGERYGWVPDRVRMDEAIGIRNDDETLSRINLDDKSITAIEIEYGALLSEDKQKRSFFFFRKLENAENIPENERIVYDDRYSPDEKIRNRHSRLIALKKDIFRRNDLKYKKEYSAFFDINKRRVVGLENWAEDVFDMLWSNLEEECLAEENAIRQRDEHYNSWQSAERRMLEEFMYERQKGFVGRSEEIKGHIDFLLNKEINSKKGICLTGTAGSGKSALFAKVHSALRSYQNNKEIILLAHSAGISTRSTSIDFLLSRWIQELAVFLNHEIWDPAYEIQEFDKKKELFYSLLSDASQKCRVICIIDSLDSFLETESISTMNWLLQEMYDNVCFFFTSVPCKSSKSLELKPWFEIKEILPFVSENGPPSNAEEFIEQQCKIQHKNSLNSRVVKALVSVKNNNTNKLACANPLWLSVAVDRLLKLDAEDHELIADVQTEIDDDKKILAYQLYLAEKMPASVEGIYSDFFTYSINRFGKRINIPWIGLMLDYIACSRSGMRESDLKFLLVGNNNEDNNKTGKQDFSRQFALVRNYMGKHLVQKDELGLWDFVHKQGRLSRFNQQLEEKNDTHHQNRGNPEWSQKIHEDIISCLHQLDKTDPFYVREIMWHYYHGDDKMMAGEYYSENNNVYANEVLANEIINADQNEAKSNSAIEWINEILTDYNDEDENESWSKKLAFDVFKIIKDHCTIKTQIKFLEVLLECQESIADEREELADIIQNNILSDDKLCVEGIDQDFIMQLKQMQSQSYANKVIQNKKSTAAIYIKHAEALIPAGRPRDALNSYKNAEEIYEYIQEELPDDRETQLNISIVNYKIRELYVRLGEIGKAQERINETETTSTQDNNKIDDYTELLTQSVEYEKIGDLKLYTKDFEEAENYYLKTFEIREKLLEINPENIEAIYNYSVCFNKIASLQREQGNFIDAVKYYEMGLKVAIKAIEKQPENILLSRSVYWNSINLGDMCRKINNLDACIKYYDFSLNVINQVLQRTPDNLDIISDLAQLYNKFCFYYVGIFETEKAMQYLKMEEEIRTNISKNHPEYKSDIIHKDR